MCEQSSTERPSAPARSTSSHGRENLRKEELRERESARNERQTRKLKIQRYKETGRYE